MGGEFLNSFSQVLINDNCFSPSPHVMNPCLSAVAGSSDTVLQSRPGTSGTSGKRKKKGADPDSEEERWLDALEEGNLEQVGRRPVRILQHSELRSEPRTNITLTARAHSCFTPPLDAFPRKHRSSRELSRATRHTDDGSG